MKQWLTILFVFIIAGSIHGQTCASTYCRDTLYLPDSSIPLIGFVSSTVPIVSRGWTQQAGPNIASLLSTGNPDSTIAFNLILGNYIFTYTVKDSLGAISTANDTLWVIQPTIDSVRVYYSNGRVVTNK